MDGVPIRDAAARLGVSVESLRKRAQRGTVTAFKDDTGAWFVVLPTEQDSGQDTVQGDGQPTGAVAALVEQLAFLQREMERRDLEIERLTGMLAESQRTVRLLLPATAGHGQDTVPEGQSVEMSKPSNRIAEDESPAPIANGAPEGVQRVQEASARPQRWPWWMRILGGK